MLRSNHASVAILALASLCGLPAPLAIAQPGAQGQRDNSFPPFDQLTKDLERVVSTNDGSAPLYDLYVDRKTGRTLAVLPRDFENQLLMVACTISGGDPQAGVMGPTHYVKWRRYDKQVALVAPNLGVRTDAGPEAKASVEELYTGRVLVVVPVMGETPDGRVVIDFGALAVQQASKFFGDSVWGGYGPSLGGVNASIIRLTKAKAFPKNFVVEYEAPRHDGQLVRVTYSIGELSGTPGYEPRKADNRVGYFYDFHQDFARPTADSVTERYLNRWFVEKADASLAMSPPKQPIVWYIESTTPVKFRRYVRDGILMWNRAFEAIGIVGAVEVYQQDAATGAHMDKDPEDARYNFFRWNTSDQSYAIGPSRTNPTTGEILDADVVWHQGLTRAVHNMLAGLSDDIVEQTFSADTIAFLAEHPEWDPRVRLARPAERERLMQLRAAEVQEALTTPVTEPGHPWARGASDTTNTACRIGRMLALDVSLFDAALAAEAITADTGSLLDGVPEEFIGPMIRYISAHEVGHCLGLQHNMAASTIRTLKDINTPGYSGPTTGSVMDYVAANINFNLGDAQGPYATPVVGPYDMWAIAYGYGPKDKIEEILKQSSNPDHLYVSQIEMSVGSDPRNMTWDMGADNLQYCASRIALAKDLRAKLLTSIVDDGESWAVARRRYEGLLGTHVQCLSIASRWIGGAYTSNDTKGTPDARTPVEAVPADQQRKALRLIIDNAFDEAAFGLSPDLVKHFGKEYWWDPDGTDELMADPSFNVHDTVGGIQAAALTFVMNPGALRRVYDNEFRAAGDTNLLTVAELVSTLTNSVWSECLSPKSGSYSAASPMVSSFRRNLQREHADRLVTLALLDRTTSPAMRTISTLAVQELGRIKGAAEKAAGANPDPYTRAHLADVTTRIDRAMEAAYVVTR